MSKVAGYGRYKDDPEHVGCPRAKTDMTPCVARDGGTAEADDHCCVGCGENPADLLTALVREVTGATNGPQASEQKRIEELERRLRAVLHLCDEAAGEPLGSPYSVLDIGEVREAVGEPNGTGGGNG